MKRAKLVNCRNYFNQKSFDEVCNELEKGEKVQVYIDVIGHTRNNMEQEIYREELEKKYGDRLIVEQSSGWCSYYYMYELK